MRGPVESAGTDIAIPCFGFGQDMLWAAFIAPNRCGVFTATGFPIAANNGRAGVTPRQTLEHHVTIRRDSSRAQVHCPLAVQEIPNADFRHVSTRVIRVAEREPMTCRTSD